MPAIGIDPYMLRLFLVYTTTTDWCCLCTLLQFFTVLFNVGGPYRCLRCRCGVHLTVVYQHTHCLDDKRQPHFPLLLHNGCASFAFSAIADSTLPLPGLEPHTLLGSTFHTGCWSVFWTSVLLQRAGDRFAVGIASTLRVRLNRRAAVRWVHLRLNDSVRRRSCYPTHGRYACLPTTTERTPRLHCATTDSVPTPISFSYILTLPHHRRIPLRDWFWLHIMPSMLVLWTGYSAISGYSSADYNAPVVHFPRFATCQAFGLHSFSSHYTTTRTFPLQRYQDTPLSHYGLMH